MLVQATGRSYADIQCPSWSDGHVQRPTSRYLQPDCVPVHRAACSCSYMVRDHAIRCTLVLRTAITINLSLHPSGRTNKEPQTC